jgi:hypothetical protein
MVVFFNSITLTFETWLLYSYIRTHTICGGLIYCAEVCLCLPKINFMNVYFYGRQISQKKETLWLRG